MDFQLHRRSMPLTPMLFKGQILFSESLSQTQSFDPEHLRNLGVDWEISSIFFIFVSHWFCKQQSKLKSEWSPQIPNHHHFRPPPKRSFTNFLTQSLLQGHNKTFRYQYQRERNLIYFNILVLNFSLIMTTCLWQKKKDKSGKKESQRHESKGLSSWQQKGSLAWSGGRGSCVLDLRFNSSFFLFQMSLK